MYKSIAYFNEFGVKSLEKKVESFIREGKDIADLVIGMQEDLFQFARNMIAETLEGMDDFLREAAFRKIYWNIERRNDIGSILTSFGTVEYQKTYFKSKTDNSTKHLIDELVGITPHDRVSEDVKINAITEAVESSYRKGGTKGSFVESITKQTVKNFIHDLEIELPEEKVMEKKVKKILYIEADEDHVSLQFHRTKGDLRADTNGYKINTAMPRLVYIHEGIEVEGKDKKRGKLINKHHFGGMYKDVEELWNEVAIYIAENYEEEMIETIYLSGDGAAWIKKGLDFIDKSIFVLDAYHLKKYIVAATSHIGDSAEDARDEIKDAFSMEDKEALKDTFARLIDAAETDAKKDNIQKSLTYIRNNWKGIIIKNTKGYEIVGCSAEGHVSHIYSDRMSSRPLGWVNKGVDHMARLRIFRENGGNVYDLVMYQKRKKQKEEVRAIQDEIVQEARKHAGKYNDGMNVTFSAVENGKKTTLSDALRAMSRRVG